LDISRNNFTSLQDFNPLFGIRSLQNLDVSNNPIDIPNEVILTSEAVPTSKFLEPSNSSSTTEMMDDLKKAPLNGQPKKSKIDHQRKEMLIRNWLRIQMPQLGVINLQRITKRPQNTNRSNAPSGTIKNEIHKSPTPKSPRKSKLTNNPTTVSANKPTASKSSKAAKLENELNTSTDKAIIKRKKNPDNLLSSQRKRRRITNKKSRTHSTN
jgi:hypothetical protein